MSNLNSVQRERITDILKKAEIMNKEDLESLMCNISSSDGNMKVKELVLEGIDSIMNKKQLTNIATVPSGDMKFDEE